MVYIDDIVIFEEHMKNITDMLNRLREHKVMTALEKCTFSYPTFKILGHMFLKKGIEASNDKIKAILDFPQPATKDELVRFLDIVSWVR